MYYKNTIEIAAFQGIVRLEIAFDEINNDKIWKLINKKSDSDAGKILSGKKKLFDRYLVTALADKFRASKVEPLSDFDVEVFVDRSKGVMELIADYEVMVKVPSNRQMVVK